jgi:predicted transglutaminase-like cysteine proteinase
VALFRSVLFARLALALGALGLVTPLHADIGVDGPVGWQAMCRQTPAYCNRVGAAAAPALDAARISVLQEVNVSVNRAIRPASRVAGRDPWRIAPARGLCADYALTKKHELQARGWPARHLRFATVLTEQGEPHAILLVDTALGPVALDSRHDDVLYLSALEARGYLTIAIEGEGPGGTWRATPEAAFALLVQPGTRLAADF